MAISKMFSDFRIYFAFAYVVIAGIILYLVYNPIFDHSIALSEISFFYKGAWSLMSVFLGFSLLLLKICINNLGNTMTEPKKAQTLLRYWIYYPIMLVMISLLSVSISTNEFKLPKLPYFLASTLLSFFLGFLIDDLQDILKGFVGKESEKEK